MTLRIITGTITDAKDPFGKLGEMKELGLFYKWHWNGNDIGWTYEPSHAVSSVPPTNIGATHTHPFSIIQTTGSGKTIILALYLYRAHLNQINTGANFSLKWTENNKGKSKDKWLPMLQSMEDFENAKFMHIGIDDIRGTITGWQCKEAKIISALSLLSRKFGDWVDVTTQRLEGFVPPDMRYITDEYIVPYIRAVDETRRAPDGRGTPLEIIAMRFSPGYELLDYKIYNLNNKLGRDLLESYDTLQVAIGLKQGEDAPRTNQPGYQLEAQAFEFLKSNVPAEEWKHLSGKHVFDIISEDFAIDVCSMDEDGNLRTEHKNMMQHISTSTKKGQIPYLMFPFKESWGFLRINKDLDYRTKGNKIDTFRLRLRTFDKAFCSQTNE